MPGSAPFGRRSMRMTVATAAWLTVSSLACELTASVGLTASASGADSVATSASADATSTSDTTDSNTVTSSVASDASDLETAAENTDFSGGNPATSEASTLVVTETTTRETNTGSTAMEGTEMSASNSGTSRDSSDSGYDTDLPFGCTPLPDELPCRLCIRRECCDAVDACLDVPGCACWLFCAEDANPPAPCDELCSASPEGEAAYACAQTQCAGECPES